MKLGILCSLIVALVVGGSAYAIAGGSDSPSGTSGSGAAVATTKVKIEDFKFIPETIKVKAGAKIQFTNLDITEHTATSREQGTFETGDIEGDKTGSVTIEEPGTYEYYCVYHAYMNGTIEVTR